MISIHMYVHLECGLKADIDIISMICTTHCIIMKYKFFAICSV